jgi:hypothetical protein
MTESVIPLEMMVLWCLAVIAITYTDTSLTKLAAKQCPNRFFTLLTKHVMLQHNNIEYPPTASVTEFFEHKI